MGSHGQNDATASAAASDAPRCRFAAGVLTPAEAAPLLGYSRRHVARLLAEGYFPANCVVQHGHGKKRSSPRLLLQRLIEARLVLPQAAEQVSP